SGSCLRRRSRRRDRLPEQGEFMTTIVQTRAPELARVAEDLIRGGTSRTEAVARVVEATGEDVDRLRTAKTWWVRRMPRFRWNDYTGVHVLAVLEEALAQVDSLVPDQTGA
ncbi:MAG TPA: hypothetical protein VK088_00775, partial [Acidimicrobiia bacterium]|nr:hypothetical protein [Acidimicrobiia bacterium]